MKFITTVLINNIKKNAPDLAANFSEYALTKIAEEKLSTVRETTDYRTINNLTLKCVASLENQLETTHKDQKDLLQDCLEGDCEYPLEVIAEMTPRQKIKIWLEYHGIQGYTDDILDVVSAAYGIVLEPDLNR